MIRVKDRHAIIRSDRQFDGTYRGVALTCDVDVRCQHDHPSAYKAERCVLVALFRRLSEGVTS